MNGAEPGLKQTPLHALHLELGAKMVEFAGWDMPVQYPEGIIAEHRQCRESAALFDVSHMGQVLLADDGQALENLVPGAITSLKPGKARYTVFTNERGGILDDLIVSMMSDGLFLVVNASMREQDLAHLRKHLGDARVHEITDRALLAVQGPGAEAIVATLAPDAVTLGFMETGLFELCGAECRVSRLGYTGEDGFEISTPAGSAIDVAGALLAQPGCKPAGLGARDTLRLEAGLCLYGNDIDQDTSPIEAGLQWTIPKRRRETGGFPGATRILGELSDGPGRKLVGLKPEGRAPARRGTEIAARSGESVGTVTSGGFAPSVGGPIAMGYVAADQAAPATPLDLIVRGKSMPATVVDLPFVAHNYRR